MDWGGDHSSVVGPLLSMYEALHLVSKHHRVARGDLSQRNTSNVIKSSKLRKRYIWVVKKTLERECHPLTVRRETG